MGTCTCTLLVDMFHFYCCVLVFFSSVASFPLTPMHCTFCAVRLLHAKPREIAPYLLRSGPTIVTHRYTREKKYDVHPFGVSDGLERKSRALVRSIYEIYVQERK